MADALVQLNLQVVLADANSDEVDVEARRLHRELWEANFAIAEVHEAAPVGVKSPEAFTLGALTVALVPKLLPQLIRVLSGWLSSRTNRSLRLKLPNGLEWEMSGSMSDAETKELIERLTAAGMSKAAGR